MSDCENKKFEEENSSKEHPDLMMRRINVFLHKQIQKLPKPKRARLVSKSGKVLYIEFPKYQSTELKLPPIVFT